MSSGEVEHFEEQLYMTAIEEEGEVAAEQESVGIW